MRYYNENPQVTFWKGQAIKWKAVAEEYLNQFKEFNKQTKEASDLVKDVNEQIKESLEVSKGWEKIADLSIEQMRQFNSLPWYKKMFYKFKLDK